jgi:hypothetical protein
MSEILLKHILLHFKLLQENFKVRDSLYPSNLFGYLISIKLSEMNSIRKGYVKLQQNKWARNL